LKQAFLLKFSGMTVEAADDDSVRSPLQNTTVFALSFTTVIA